MEPDGHTEVRYVPDPAANIKATLALVKKLGLTPTFAIPLRVPAPPNERPWHKHTLPSRRRR